MSKLHIQIYDLEIVNKSNLIHIYHRFGIPLYTISETSSPNGTEKYSPLYGYIILENEIHIDYANKPDGFEFRRFNGETLFTIPTHDLRNQLPLLVRAKMADTDLKVFDQLMSLREKMYTFYEHLQSQNFDIIMYELKQFNDGYSV